MAHPGGKILFKKKFPSKSANTVIKYNLCLIIFQSFKIFYRDLSKWHNFENFCEKNYENSMIILSYIHVSCVFTNKICCTYEFYLILCHKRLT